MAYLGNAPARSFISFERQVFTIVNSQTAYTLSHSVTNENDIRLVVNNVVQEPGSGKAYTATGTTLTLSAALTNGTDEMYCVFLGRAVGTVNAPAGSVGTSQLADLNVTTGKIAADAITNAKIADDAISDEQLDPTVITGQTAETSIATDDLILLSDTSASGALRKMTRANFVSGVGGDNTPAFYANMSGTQTVSASTHTTIAFATEVLDTDNAYNTSTYKFTPQTAGYYQFFVTVRMDTVANTEVMMYIQDTNNSKSYVLTDIIATQWMCAGSRIIYANGSSDAFEARIWQNSGSNKTITSPIEQSSWGAFRILT
ncbi:complement C1q domain-containing protein [Flavobacteriaceae bacterium]|nr:complement C1q domain-containing protein [Flavobacteriaceae bacterium]